MKDDLQGIILAAGKSTRFKTGRTKLAERICGQKMILYPTTLLQNLNIKTTVIVGFQQDRIKEIIIKKHNDHISFVTQEQQQGTGHALALTHNQWEKEHILVINGDMPLVTESIIKQLYAKHKKNNAAISFVMAHNPDPSTGSYGRVVKTKKEIQIVEAKDFDGDTHEHCCINAGIYIIAKKFLTQHIDALANNNASKEFYITDLVKIASDNGQPIATVTVPFDHVRGINTFHELWAAEQVKRAELIKYWMEQGVRFSVAQNVHIDLNVSIGAGTYIGCGVHLLGNTTIGKNCKIFEFSSLQNTTLDEQATIYPHCIINNAHIGAHASVGPYAHLHDNTHIGSEAVIGNFVEVKNSTIGNQTKAKHLSYLGDATIGSHVNIGAGTITCNHNGTQKQKTIIKDNAYIGSNNSLVAPVTIHEKAFTGAGSVITQDVPADALALGRARQINKKGYATKLRERNIQKNEAVKKNSEQKTGDNKTFSFVGARVIHPDVNPIDEP